jgi:lipid-A-disaccharide synthase-like uncharacterized protein
LVADLLSLLTDWAHAVFVAQFDVWVIVGLIGQALFMMRFVVQWLASERAKRSVVPLAFWFFSIGGGVVLLIYSIQRQDPVYIAGQGLGLIIYIRNLMLIGRSKTTETGA